MIYTKPTISDYGDFTALTRSMPAGGPEDCGGKNGTPAGHTVPQGPACPSGKPGKPGSAPKH
jgi:hypothetical protein